MCLSVRSGPSLCVCYLHEENNFMFPHNVTADSQTDRQTDRQPCCCLPHSLTHSMTSLMGLLISRLVVLGASAFEGSYTHTHTPPTVCACVWCVWLCLP